MEINIIKEGNKLLVTPIGRIDSTTSPEFESKVNQVFDATIEDLKIDMTNVDFISSKGIRIFLTYHRQMGTKGKFILANINNSVREVLKLSALLEVFNIE